MKTFILMTVAVFTLSACAAGSANRVNYQAPTVGTTSSKISPHKCYSPELLSLATYTDADRKAVTCRND